MARGSQHDQDEIAWVTKGLVLGTVGLDLRQPSDPDALSDLRNARFVDERRVQQRPGHVGYTLQYGAAVDPVGASCTFTDQWVYGHGARIDPSLVGGWGNARSPVQIRGAATFSLDGGDVVWTGDRLLVARKDGQPAVGSSALWSRTGTTAEARGIPAYLPLETSATPPAFVGSGYVETCLTTAHRLYAHTDSGSLFGWVLDRNSSAVLDHSKLSNISTNPGEPRVFMSGGYAVVLWRDLTSRVLYLTAWNGATWSGEAVVASDVYGFDIVTVPGGFHLLMRRGAGTQALFLGRYVGVAAQSTPYQFNASLDMTGLAGVTGAIAFDVAPSGHFGVLCEASSGLVARVFTAAAATVASVPWTVMDAATSWSGLSIRSRGLAEQNGFHSWVVHAGHSGVVSIRQFSVNSGIQADSLNQKRFNSTLASKSFRVGDEIFCWLRSTNANTHYLVGGVAGLQVCGYADTEEATVRNVSDGNLGVPLVQADPLDTTGTKFVWSRPYNTGQPYSRVGNVRAGDLDFLPTLSTAKFGHSLYLSGCAVRNWDGVQLGDAGFQDFPVVTANTPSSSGGSLGTGDYFFRVYPVRYNARGERFQGAAVTYGPVTFVSGTTNKVDLTIATLPSTNHADVIFEVYRTEAGGEAFYLDGVVANSLTAATVTYTSTRRDESAPLAATDLVEQLGDPHAPVVGQAKELQEAGPTGCALLAASGDRLWGAGGQVPAGRVQFSKLHEPGEGAGFDPIADFQEVDTEGQTITLIHRLNDTVVVHQQRGLFVLTGTGPDNFGSGAFAVPQIVLADGAAHGVSVPIQHGVLYWGQDGPRALTNAFEVVNISASVRPLAATLTPTGVRVDLSKQEAVWYTSSGDALLWNYLGNSSRWARWTGLYIAGCSDTALVTTDGHLLVESDDADGDEGRAFEFRWTTGDLRITELLQGAQLLRAVGVVGAFLAPHQLRARVFYNGSPLWTDEWTWHPEVNTWLATGDDHATRTPAQIDSDLPQDKSGAYLTHKRVSRNDCSFFRVEVSTVESLGPSYIPFELSVELGVRAGLGRVPSGNFGG